MTTTIEQGPVAGALPPAENGWHRDSVWVGTSMAGDDALYEATAYYERGDECLEVTYYVVESPYTYNGVEEPAWGIEEMDHYYRVDADGVNIDSPDEQYAYECGDPRYFFSFDAAVMRACAMANEDEAWKLG